jgi:hypothetical protein
MELFEPRHIWYILQSNSNDTNCCNINWLSDKCKHDQTIDSTSEFTNGLSCDKFNSGSGLCFDNNWCNIVIGTFGLGYLELHKEASEKKPNDFNVVKRFINDATVMMKSSR